jgi:hypothetical protein
MGISTAPERPPASPTAKKDFRMMISDLGVPDKVLAVIM